MKSKIQDEPGTKKHNANLVIPFKVVRTIALIAS